MNRIKHQFLYAILLAIPVLMGAGLTTKGLRFHTNLSAAKQLAANEGKLYLVDFTAKWCMPCQWMEETTFADDRVVNYMKENYVAVKIDIDDFDGFAYKQLYGIKVLPSILIFNSKGELLEQYTGSHAPSGLLKILKEHDQPQNRIKAGNSNLAATTQPATTSPNHRPTRPTLKPTNTETTANNSAANVPNPTANKPAAQPTRKPKRTISKPKLTPTPSKPAPAASTARPTAYNAPAAKPTPSYSRPAMKPAAATTTSAAPEVMEEGLFKFAVTRKARQGFSVQIGVFAEYGNVLREVEKLEKRFNKPVLVHIAKMKNKTVYKVLVGEFNDYNSASSFKAQVVADGTEGMVKDLTKL